MNRIIFILLSCLSLISFVNGQDIKPEKKLNAAIYQEEVNGDLEEAMRLYDEIVNEFPDSRSVVAEALYRNGIANEKLGNLKARQYYESVIQNYSDQSEMVRLARIRLNRILKKEKPDDVQKEDDEDLSVIDLYEKGSWLENSSLSPDGTKLAGIDFSIGQNVAVYDRLTNRTQMITKYDELTPDHCWTYFPVWSPDGKEIAYMFYGKNGICELQASTLQGKTRTIIKNESKGGQIISRQWSQDGSKILTFKQDSSGFYTIGLVPAKGGSFKALYNTQWKGRFIKGDASLSPDGKVVVFADGPEDNFDIFIMSTEGGTPTILHGHPGSEYDPLWSPDGKYIVFIKETKGGSFLYGIEMAEGKPVGQPFLIKEGMQNVNLIDWTAQGITYDLSLDIRDIYTLNIHPGTGIQAGTPRPLDYTPVGSNLCPVWSHDAKYLAFISYDVKAEVVIMPADGGETRHYNIPVTEFRAAGMWDLRWLPDNSGVGFSLINSMDISIMYHLDLATGNWQTWPLPIQTWTRTEWGPDGNSFVYAKWGGEEPGIYQFNIITEETHRIYQPDTAKAWYSIRGLKFSRDHKKLTFRNKNRGVDVLDLETGECRNISQTCWSPTFSPDGQKILAFGRFEKDGIVTKGVVILSLDGEILQQYDIAKYFSSGTIYAPDWSPDGKHLVFETLYRKMGTYLMKNVLK